MAAYTNAKQCIPGLFMEIMRNQAERQALAAPPLITMGEVRQHATLMREMAEYRRGAERALRWNIDKGNTA